MRGDRVVSKAGGFPPPLPRCGAAIARAVLFVPDGPPDQAQGTSGDREVEIKECRMMSGLTLLEHSTVVAYFPLLSLIHSKAFVQPH